MTINVPRELLERAAYTLELAYEVDTPTVRDIRALLSAPSPAGVDGLEVVEYQERSIYGNWNRIYKLAYDKRLAAGCPEQFRTLSVTAEAQTIIDGLRGEVERLDRESQSLSNQLGSCGRDRNLFRAERDQQARRVGELERLLNRVKVSLSLDDTEWGYSATEKYKLLADIRATLSAEKEKQDERS